MKYKQPTILEKNCKYVLCSIGVRYWEDATVNGVEDTEDGENIPCKEDEYWNIKIDVDTGIIQDWDNTKTATTHYKSCDENVFEFLDDEENVITRYDGYVPEFLECTGENGYGDYVLLEIEKNGQIKNWKPYECIEFLEKVLSGEIE